MSLIEKNPLKSVAGLRFGYVLKLSGVIGLESESKDFQEVFKEFQDIKANYISEVIIVDATKLERWNTYGLKAIFPILVEVNKALSSKGRPPIPIIGSKDRDIFQAVVERHEQDIDKVPWFNSVEEFRDRYSL